MHSAIGANTGLPSLPRRRRPGQTYGRTCQWTCIELLKNMTMLQIATEGFGIFTNNCLETHTSANYCRGSPAALQQELEATRTAQLNNNNNPK